MTGCWEVRSDELQEAKKLFKRKGPVFTLKQFPFLPPAWWAAGGVGCGLPHGAGLSAGLGFLS